MFLRFELVRTKDLETTSGFGLFKTLIGTLKKLEDIFDDDRLEVDLFLIIQIFRLQLDLKKTAEQKTRRLYKENTQ